MESGGGRTLLWTAENQPKSITTAFATENYLYTADGERVKRTTNVDTQQETTVFFGAMAEELLETGRRRHAYVFNGHTIAERDVPTSGASTFRYLHSDHLGSVGTTSTSNTSPTVTRQYFTPWGEARHGNLTGTTERNYTGQRKDAWTGLLFYNARYYDAKLGRFISADSIVPGMASGKGGSGSIGVDGNTKSMLTVDYHEPQFAAGVGVENAFTRENGFYFELSGKTQQEARYQWGPANAQALNRYSYVLNNPLRYTDPTGHAIFGGNEDAGYASSCSAGPGKPVVDCGGDYNKEVRKGCDKNGENCTHRMVHIWYVDDNGVRHEKWVWDNLKDSNDPFDEFRMYADKLPAAWNAVMVASGGAVSAGGLAALGCAASGGLACAIAFITILGGVTAIQYQYDQYDKARRDAVRAAKSVPSV
jgi:RHS repeat-associated protein